MWTFLGLIALLAIGAASGYAGYQEGLELRTGAEATARIGRIQEQYELGLQDQAEGRYDRARQRFEYVIQLDPGFPGVTDRLAEVLLELNTTATPTIAPTPTLTPTPDLRTEEQLYADGQQYLLDGQWTRSIDTLLALRKTSPQYQAVEIDGMLYLALRNRGWDKIVKDADLEGGIYDLALAERFGPLDAQAQGLKTWTELYITGASFWEIDWGQTVYYFDQVAPHYPNLRDGSGMSAAERLRRALIGYGNTLASQDQWCDAAAQYQRSLDMGYDAQAEEALAKADKNCNGGDEEKEDIEEGTPDGQTGQIAPALVLSLIAR